MFKIVQVDYQLQITNIRHFNNINIKPNHKSKLRTDLSQPTGPRVVLIIDTALSICKICILFGMF